MNRWHVVVALLRAPAAESRRLAALLTRWPTAEVRRHLLRDDCARRLWVRGSFPEGAVRVIRAPEAS